MWSFPQRLWSAPRKPCGQVGYLLDGKGERYVVLTYCAVGAQSIGGSNHNDVAPGPPSIAMAASTSLG